MARPNRLKKNLKKLKKLLPAVTVTLTTVPFVAWSPSASAFFPPVWPISPPVVVVPPTASPPVLVVPPVSPPPFSPPPGPPVVVPPTPSPPVLVPPTSPPSGVPEPATLVSALIGLGAAAGYGLKRRLDKKDEPKPE